MDVFTQALEAITRCLGNLEAAKDGGSRYGSPYRPGRVREWVARARKVLTARLSATDQ